MPVHPEAELCETRGKYLMMMRKRTLSLICALALCLGLLPVTALAVDGDLVATVTIDDQTTEYRTDDSTDAEAAFLAAWTACQSNTATLKLKKV